MDQERWSNDLARHSGNILQMKMALNSAPSACECNKYLVQELERMLKTISRQADIIRRFEDINWKLEEELYSLKYREGA